jgi:flavin reductase (DIM6/NTAB) family NADH-FMN oxidoreductase RutF
MGEIKTIVREDIARMDKEFRRNLINCLSGFKSVCLCGTAAPHGSTNLSVISSVVHIGANPPLMGMILRPPVVERNTLSNILETGFFTLNHLTRAIYEQGHQTAARYSKNESEFSATGLREWYSDILPAPYVEESPVKIGLEFRERIDIATNGTVLLIGEIVEIIVPKADLLEDGYLDIEKAGTITIAGLDAYHASRKLTRLSYPKAGEPLKKKDAF